VKILGYQPSRRRVLRNLLLFTMGAPLVKLGRVLPAHERRRRRRAPDDVPPIPWIGHC
jgi:hypothetical protein